jgi:hypothetical protein
MLEAVDGAAVEVTVFRLAHLMLSEDFASGLHTPSRRRGADGFVRDFSAIDARTANCVV